MDDNPDNWSSVIGSEETNGESGFLDGITEDYEQISSFSVADFKSLAKEEEKEDQNNYDVHINCIRSGIDSLSLCEISSLPCYEQDFLEEPELAVLYLYEMKNFIHMFNYAFSILHYSLVEDCENGKRPNDISMERNFFIRCGNQLRNFFGNCHRLDSAHYPWNIPEDVDVISSKVKTCNELLKEQTEQLEDGSYPNWTDSDLRLWRSRTRLLLSIDKYIHKVVKDLRNRPDFDLSSLSTLKPSPRLGIMYKVEPDNNCEEEQIVCT